jgi:hypothetical protein
MSVTFSGCEHAVFDDAFERHVGESKEFARILVM